MWEFVIEGLLNLLLEFASPVLETLFDFEAWPGFCACSLSSLAGAGIMDWLLPATKCSHLLCALVIAVGIGAGILLERCARQKDGGRNMKAGE